MNRIAASWAQCGFRWYLLANVLVCVVAPSTNGQDDLADVAKHERADLYGDPLPDGAIARLGTLRFRTGSDRFSGQSIAFVPGRQLLVARGPSGGVAIWDPLEGKVLREIQVTDHSIESFDVSRDGSRVATLAYQLQRATREYDVLLQVWLVQTGERLLNIRWTDPLQEQCKRLTFTPDGQSIATGGLDGKVRIWDLASGTELLNHQTVKGEVESLAFSPDGELLAVASRQGVVLWRWLEGEEPESFLTRGNHGALSVAFSPEGKWLATGSDERRGIRVWDVATAQLQWQIDGEYEGGFYPHRIEFTPDGRMLAVPLGQQGERVELRGAATGKLLHKYDSDGVAMRHVAVSSDQQWIAGQGNLYTLHVWRISDREPQEPKFVGHREPAYKLSFANDGRHVVTAGIDGTIRVWNDKGTQLRQMRHDNRWVVGVAVSPDRKHIASLGFDRALRVWDFDSGHEVYDLPGHARLGGADQNEVAFTPDGSRFLSFGSDMFLRIWDTRTGKAIAEHDIRPEGLDFERSENGEINAPNDPFGGEDRIPFAVEKVVFTSDCRYLLLSASGSIFAFDTEKGHQTSHFECARRGRFAVSSDASKLVTIESHGQPAADGTPSYMIRLRGFASTKIVREIMLPAGTFPGDVCFAPDGRRLAIAVLRRIDDSTNRYSISIRDSVTGDEQVRIESAQRAAKLAFSSDGMRIAASYDDTTVMIWDIAHFGK